ncbi:hypothetical protein M3Y98_00222500 [Aphelenchoides besseyi]|nr:hypothetical protein M3Y98_00222500 [Aphelenchoides besseyi]KAI6200492.1 hypothetical protein M3Y96_00740000 [Aphelenchoides besseyi]
MAEINERASTSVDCPLSPTSTHSDELTHLAGEAFEKISAYVQGQVDASVDDYKLLEEMNGVTSQRYKDMHNVAGTISNRLTELSEKYETLRPYLEQIDQIDEASKRLEETVCVLEKYLATLESKLRTAKMSPTH